MPTTTTSTISPIYYITPSVTTTGNIIYDSYLSDTTACTTSTVIDPYSTTSATTGWTHWGTLSGSSNIITPPTINVITPEENARLELLEQRRAADKIIRDNAISKANKLLVDNLTDTQKLDYDKFGYFFVESLSGQKYRIRKGRQINIDVMSQDKISRRICAHPIVSCPDEDTMLVQKIMLETSESAFLNIAKEYH